MDIVDPDLTARGIEQARLIGKKLRIVFDEFLTKKSSENKAYDNEKNIKLKFETSPFWRTLSTSLKVIEGYGVECDSIKDNRCIKINVNYELYEYLSCSQFKFHPEKFLKFAQTKNPPWDNSIKYGNPPYYPEDINNCINRYRGCIKKLKEDFINTNSYFDVILIVTHGYGVQVIAEYLNINVEWFVVDYCYTFVFGLNEDGSSEYIKGLTPD
jgi:broad specificity phosphatase PhoE